MNTRVRTPPANHVAFLRRARGWSQVELAERAGISRSAVEAIEAGRVPRSRTKQRLAAAFGLAAEDLFPEQEQ